MHNWYWRSSQIRGLLLSLVRSNEVWGSELMIPIYIEAKNHLLPLGDGRYQVQTRLGMIYLLTWESFVCFLPINKGRFI